MESAQQQSAARLMSARSRLAAGLGAIAPAVALAVALTITTIPGPAAAQTPRGFPAKPVRIVTVGPGSQGDVLSRLLAPKLAEIWGQPVVVENRAGAGGTLAAATVAKATPDGYTFLLQSNQFAVSAALHANLPYDPIRDFAGISQLGNGTVVLYVPPSLGPRTVKELIALAHAKPVLLYSSSGAGSGAHLNNEMFRYAAGIKATHVGFRSSSEAMIEVVASRVHFSVLPLGTGIAFIKDGRLIPLAAAEQRSPLIPDVPAMSEVVPNYQRSGAYGLLAPAATPKTVLLQINTALRRVLEQPDIQSQMYAMAFAAAPTTPEEFDRIVRRDIETYSKLVRVAGLRK
jgi:tripartite-type tricarboxylate transporter receptor subunit TctC